MVDRIRVLFLADTHLGFDLPLRPRVARRRRGHDFQANFEAALAPALRGQCDLVVHGGDLFHRSLPPAAVVDAAMEPLLAVARAGVPVVLVAGNHERSRIPRSIFANHARFHIIESPRVIRLDVCGLRVTIAGFPFARRVRSALARILSPLGAEREASDARLLVMHQAVEGAQVGAQNFTFREGHDVIPGQALPGYVAAVLSGHIHRAQVLRQDLSGLPLPSPVIYPGSVERTSYVERHETKSYTTFELMGTPCGRGRIDRLSTVPLPARPMREVEVPAKGDVSDFIRTAVSDLPKDAIVRLSFLGRRARVPSADELRDLIPPTMNVNMSLGRGTARRAGAQKN